MTLKFAVFCHVNGRGRRIWNAYTRDFSTEWGGYVGMFDGTGTTRARAKSDAIDSARRVLVEAYVAQIVTHHEESK